MKNFILLFLSFTLLTSCLKDDFPKDYSEENDQEILAYLADKNLTAEKDDSGIYYITENQGTGLQPKYENGDVVTVNYTGSLTDGTIFDENNNSEAIFSLLSVIDGWKIGIPFFKEGGKGKLIIPSRWGYGSSTNGDIPAGSVLVFDIELLSVNFTQENEAEITEYLTENNLTDTALKTSSGLYYIIDEKGEGEAPSNDGVVTVAYKGYFTNGDVFDESDESGIAFGLESVIQGWTEGIPYFNEGGSGKLLIPSKLGYGNFTTNNGIPGGSVLIFDINLISVN